MTSLSSIIEYTIHPTSDSAIAYWAGQEEPTELELTLIEWHPEVYPTFRSKENEEHFGNEYEF